MSAWAYCHYDGCEIPLAKPTMREAFQGHVFCKNGHCRTISSDERGDLLCDMDERVLELEALVAKLIPLLPAEPEALDDMLKGLLG